jgi:hypothetical protein
MIAEGLNDEGFATAKGVNNVVWRDRGYFFRTPGGIRHPRPVPRQHVHAARVDLGYGVRAG